MYFRELSVENGWLSPVTKYMLHVYSLLMIPYFTKIYMFQIKGRQSSFNTNGVICSYYFRKRIAFPLQTNGMIIADITKFYLRLMCFETWEGIHFQ